MNLDDVTEAWRSNDVSQLWGVDTNLLHEVLRQEQATQQQRRRRMRHFVYAVNAVLLVTVVLFFAILIDPNQPEVFADRLTVWDYMLGGIGLAAVASISLALSGLRRSFETRDREFGDTLRDHLRRRIAHLDAQLKGERRFAITIMVSTLIAGKTIALLAGRIQHEPAAWSDMLWPSPIKLLLILGLFYLMFFRWIPAEQQHHVTRKRDLETVLRELDTE